MKGLLVKELYTVYNYRISFLVQLVVAAALFFVFPGSFGTMVVAILVSSNVTMAIGTFAYDESANWERYATALPVARKTIVGAKYLFLFLFMLLVSAIAFTLGILGGLFSGQEGGVFAAVITGVVLLCIALLALAATLPVAFALGHAKARSVMMVCYIALFALIGFSIFSMGGEAFDAALELLPLPLVAGGGVALCVALYWASCLVAQRLYAKREF